MVLAETQLRRIQHVTPAYATPAHHRPVSGRINPLAGTVGSSCATRAALTIPAQRHFPGAARVGVEMRTARTTTRQSAERAEPFATRNAPLPMSAGRPSALLSTFESHRGLQ